MTKVVFVGDIYNADLQVGGGPMPGGPGQPGTPTHPIYNPVYPDQGLPPGQGGYPSHPIHYPGSPSHPIYNPAYPDNTLPQPPLHIWGGGNVPMPTPPIWLPAQPVIPDAGDPTKAHVVVYVPGAGAVKFTVDLTELPEKPPPTEAQPK